MTLTEWIRENTRTIVAVGALYVAYVEYGGGQYPETPEWAPLVAGAAVAAGLVALFTSGVLEDLFPEEHGIYLQMVNTYQTEKLPVWELSEDQFADLTVVNGPLNPLPENVHESYEVFAYDSDRNLAVGTWRKSRPASQIVGHNNVDDALDTVRELRNYMEPEARKGHQIRQNVSGIVRALDARRLENQTRMLEEDLAPSFGETTIDSVVQEQLPDHLLPSRLQNDDLEDIMAGEASPNGEDVERFGEFELLEDGEALEPVETTNGGAED